ncbi:MAG: DUF4221 family protein, partial [Bacteroidota bacterium]
NVHLLNGSGTRLKTIRLNPFVDTKNKFFVSKDVSFPGNAYSPDLHTVVDNHLYITGSMDDSWSNKNSSYSGMLLSVNLEQGQATYHFPYPDIYKNDTWSIYFKFVFGAYNPEKKFFLLSFPADRNIYITDKDGKILDTKFAGSIYQTTDIPPTSSGKKNDVPSELRDKHYYQNICYRYIMYDKYRKVYYRFCEQPMNDYIPGGNNMKQMSAIILNENLEVIGEFLFPKGKKFIPGIMYVSSEGLHVLKLDQNEDILSYTNFVLKNK